DGVCEGGEVSIHYDPMLSKLIVHAATREACIERMLLAIDNYNIRGLKTTLDFGRFAINHQAFRSGDFDTGFVNDHFTPEKLIRELPVSEDVFTELASGLYDIITEENRTESNQSMFSDSKSNWRIREVR
ncbi:MAG: biotin carboxylase, partial [Flavobacteriales bacterium]